MTAWTDIIGWTLVHFIWQGVLIGLVAAMVLRLLRRASAQARYVTACGALVLAIAAPLLTLPAVAMLLSRPESAASEAAPAAARRPDAKGTSGHELAPPAAQPWTVPARDLPRADRVTSALPLIVGIWVAGVIVLTLRLAFGWWRVRSLYLSALHAAPSRWLSAATVIAARLRLEQSIHVVDSHRIDTPTVIGWLRPVVLLPLAALGSLSPGQVEAIIAHELAHIRRHDFIVNLLQTVAETVLFYHPVIWWLSARIRAEREHCCDDIAVEACGDPVIYAEALTELASRVASGSTLAVAATGGSLADRVRRILRVPGDAERRQPKAPFVLAGTVLLVVAVGMRLMLVAQTAPADATARAEADGPPMLSVNKALGFQLFPVSPHYPTDDPRDARAWDVKVAFPGGEMPFIGFSARSLIRYAYGLNLPVMDGPAWLDTESLPLYATTPAVNPQEEDLRLALRIAFEQRYHLVVSRTVRDFPVFAMVVANPDGTLGPNIHLSTVECLEGRRPRPPIVSKQLVARGQLATLCGIDDTLLGPTGYRVSMAELARSMRHWPLDADNAREVVDQTGLTGDFDFTLRVGLLPLAAVATAHPDLGMGLTPFGIRTFQVALEEQLGLRLVQTEAPRDIAVITSATRESGVASLRVEPSTVNGTNASWAAPYRIDRVLASLRAR